MQFSEKEMRTAVEAAADYGTYVMAHLYTNPSMQRAARAGIRSFEHAHLLDEETAKIIKDQGDFYSAHATVQWKRRGSYEIYESEGAFREFKEAGK